MNIRTALGQCRLYLLYYELGEGKGGGLRWLSDIYRKNSQNRTSTSHDLSIFVRILQHFFHLFLIQTAFTISSIFTSIYTYYKINLLYHIVALLLWTIKSWIRVKKTKTYAAESIRGKREREWTLNSSVIKSYRIF